MARKEDGVLLQDIHGLNIDSTGKLTTATRCSVLRIGGDPEWIDADAPRYRDQQPHSASGVALTAELGMYAVADVTRVPHHVRSGLQPQIDGADLITVRIPHPVVPCRNMMHRMTGCFHVFKTEAVFFLEIFYCHRRGKYVVDRQR
jgi:hypothetical protein